MADVGRQQKSHLGTVILTEDSAKVHTFLGFFLAFDLADFPNCPAGVLYFFPHACSVFVTCWKITEQRDFYFV